MVSPFPHLPASRCKQEVPKTSNGTYYLLARREEEISEEVMLPVSCSWIAFKRELALPTLPQLGRDRKCNCPRHLYSHVEDSSCSQLLPFRRGMEQANRSVSYYMVYRFNFWNE